MTEKYTPEKVAEEIATAQKAVWAEIHGQDATRRYSVGEVKELVYSLDNALSSATTALTAVSAERDAALDLLGRVAGVAASSIPDLTLRNKPMAAVVDLSVTLSMAEAKAGRLHKAITEALDEFERLEEACVAVPSKKFFLRILRAALDKEGEGDGHDAG